MKLFEPMKIGKMEVKNRIVMAPMGTQNDGDGGYSTRTARYFEERAKGGTGLIITGRNASTTIFEEYSTTLLDKAQHVPRLNLMIEKCHLYGAKVCVQIGPGLGRIQWTNPFDPPYSASKIPAFWFPDLICRELTVEDIHKLTDKVGYSAQLAMKADADAVELHAYGSYLADQFLTPLWNKRTDEYGGSLENRTRFLIENIQAIKKYCGEDFPVIVKFTPVHCYEGGRELEEGVEIAKLLEKAGADALHVDTGCYEVWYRQIPTVYEKPGCQLFAAEAVKNAVKIPVIAQGKLNHPKLAEEIVQKEKADFIAIGHQSLADPAWANKVREGDLDEIVPCIGCNNCLHMGHKSRYYTCSVNVHCHHEDDYPLTLDEQNRKVLVIGGGPGGMMAAMTAAERGMDVKLWEKSDRLGGLLLAAGAPEFKKDVMDYVTYASNRVRKLGVKVKYNHEALPDEIIRGNYDMVVLACGATPVVPPIPGVENDIVKNSTEVLCGNKETGNVVIVGGGLVGCETALHCNETAKSVTIIEMMDQILATVDDSANNMMSLKDAFKRSNIEIHTGARVNKINKDSIEFVKDGKEHVIPADTVIIAAGYRSLNNLEQAIDGKVKAYKVIGDAGHPGKIINAVHEGFHAIRMM